MSLEGERGFELKGAGIARKGREGLNYLEAQE
jgi:hypothetical protein